MVANELKRHSTSRETGGVLLEGAEVRPVKFSHIKLGKPLLHGAVFCHVGREKTNC